MSSRSDEDVQRVIDKIEEYGYQAHPIYGTDKTVVAAVGDERGKARLTALESLPGVEAVVPILKPFKLASVEVRPGKSRIQVGDVVIGGDRLAVFAGPCSVESREQTLDIARHVKEAGANVLRGGAYKPRTSPWSFQGLREKGLEILSKVRRETGMPIVTEIMAIGDIPLIGEHTDIYQVGMRNMRNYALLAELGKIHKPVLLKRGDSAKLEEWLAAAEYIFRNGNEQVILCERGIRTFEDYTRNTLDLNAVVGAKNESCLPVIADPSHGTGRSDMVLPMSRAAVAAGAHGLLLEVHYNPNQAWSDGRQTITPRTLRQTIEACTRIHALAAEQGE